MMNVIQSLVNVSAILEEQEPSVMLVNQECTSAILQMGPKSVVAMLKVLLKPPLSVLKSLENVHVLTL